jgi:aminobenzoyl-glutamate utilization protein B
MIILYLDIIENKRDLLLSVSDKIWEFAELSLKEYKSAELYREILADEGFDVEAGVCGMETAFKARYGEGKPVIGILAEYDALSGLSQKAGLTYKEAVIPGGNGHGCGHNMLGAGALAAALAIKEYLKDKKSGSVVLYGCPGEEGGAGKAFMARDGEFKDLDAALTWHPGDENGVRTSCCNSSLQIEYTFNGVASHAAKPEYGRSALDAAELMNTGVQYLREHMPDSDRIHYAFTDAGGVSPNVVHPKASVLYMIRSHNVKNALKLADRVDKIAHGAAMMTETSVVKRFIDGTADIVPNFTLSKLLQAEFEKMGVPEYTDEETAFARAIIDSYENPEPGLPGKEYISDRASEEYIREKSQDGTKPLNDFLMPYQPELKMTMGSTDVGDVSWLTPTAQISVAACASKGPGHSWQNVSCGGSSIGHKAVLHAGKVLAAAAVTLYENPDLLKEARAEFETRAKEGYTCPIPPDAVPTAID